MARIFKGAKQETCFMRDLKEGELAEIVDVFQDNKYNGIIVVRIDRIAQALGDEYSWGVDDNDLKVRRLRTGELIEV